MYVCMYVCIITRAIVTNGIQLWNKIFRIHGKLLSVVTSAYICRKEMLYLRMKEREIRDEDSYVCTYTVHVCMVV